MNILRKPSHVGIVGKSGSGKTEYMVRYICHSHHGRVMGFDHMSEYAARLGPVGKVVDTMDEFIDAVEENRVVFYDPAEEWGGYYLEGLQEWCNVVFEIGKSIFAESQVESVVVIDELQKLVDPFSTPVEVKNLLQTGRKFGIDTCVVSQQPNRLPNELTEQWTEVAAFRLIHPKSLEALERIGMDVTGIPDLPDLHYKWMSLVTSEQRLAQMTFPTARPK